MQLRVKPSAWITTSGLSPDWTRSTARIRMSSRVLWSRARASRRFMSHCTICLLTYELVNILLFSPSLPTQAPLTLQWPSALDYHALSDFDDVQHRTPHYRTRTSKISSTQILIN